MSEMVETGPVTEKDWLVERVADEMSKKRWELINQPLARIWDELARVAIKEVHRQSVDQAQDPL